MKKIDWKEYGIQALLVTVLFVIAGIIYYIEENYELSNILWIFNIVVVIFMPLYYFIHSKKEKKKTKETEDNIIIKG